LLLFVPSLNNVQLSTMSSRMAPEDHDTMVALRDKYAGMMSDPKARALR